MTNGKAYALFDCEHPLEDINSVLRDARALEQSRLELKLSEDLTAVDEEDLRQQLIRYAFRYALRGRLRGATNEETANHLKDLMITAGNDLFDPDKKSRREIVYYDGEWKSIEDR